MLNVLFHKQAQCNNVTCLIDHKRECVGVNGCLITCGPGLMTAANLKRMTQRMMNELYDPQRCGVYMTIFVSLNTLNSLQPAIR